MKDTKEETENQKTKNTYQYVMYVLLLATIAVMAMNQIAIGGLGTSVQQTQNQKLEATATQAGSNSNGVSVPSLNIIPTGVPQVYGSELGIKYDDINPSDPAKTDATIRKLALFDVNIKLQGDQLTRYISIASNISCEYCCGAPSLIFTSGSNAGDAACGCAHSYAMRGLAKYIITKHGTEFTDTQILEELGKWKTLFFPGPIEQKAQILQKQNIEMSYINLASNKYRGLKGTDASSSSGGANQVGGC